MTTHTSPYLGNEKNDSDYPSEGTLRVLGKPYDVQHDRYSEQRDKLEPISIPRDPHDRTTAYRSQRLRGIRDLLYQGSKQEDRQVVGGRAEGCDHSRQDLVEVSDLARSHDTSRYIQCQRIRALKDPRSV